MAASAGAEVYVAEEDVGTSLAARFRPAKVVGMHATYMVIQWLTGEGVDTRTDNIARESKRIWHGSLSRLVWEEDSTLHHESEAPAQDYPMYTPKSRKYCPRSFYQLAEQHGCVLPVHLKDPVPININRIQKVQRPKLPHEATPHRMAQPSPLSNGAAALDDGAGPSTTVDAPQPPQKEQESAAEPEVQAQHWLDAVHRFGTSINDKVLMCMPEYLSLRRDLYVHSYALWQVVMVRVDTRLLHKLHASTVT